MGEGKLGVTDGERDREMHTESLITISFQSMRRKGEWWDE